MVFLSVNIFTLFTFANYNSSRLLPNSVSKVIASGTANRPVHSAKIRLSPDKTETIANSSNCCIFSGMRPKRCALSIMGANCRPCMDGIVGIISNRSVPRGVRLALRPPSLHVISSDGGSVSRLSFNDSPSSGAHVFGVFGSNRDAVR